MKTIRAKFYCDSINDEGYGDEGYGEEVKLSAVYGSDEKDNEENNQFSEATPSGNLEMIISNTTAKGFFKIGKSYYLDFSEAEN